MKKFVIKFSVFALIIIGFFFSINYFLDPYNIFHYEYPRNNGIEANKNYIKMRYILNHKNEFDSVLFGSSRAGFTDVESLPDGKYYNMCSSEAVPKEHVRLLKIMIKKGFVPKNVTVMMDDISCFVDPAIHTQMLYRIPYPDDTISSWFDFYVKYCDLITTMEACEAVKDYEPTDDDYTARFRRSGSERLNAVSDFDGTDAVGYWADYYNLRTDEVIEDVKELVSICKEYNINLRIVTNPLYYKTYTRDVENGYIEFLDALAEVTDYYNFSSFSDITTNDGNYYETSHFIPYVATKMMDTVYKDEYDEGLWKQGFGVKVTKENKDEFIYFLKYQAKENGVSVYGEPD